MIIGRLVDIQVPKQANAYMGRTNNKKAILKNGYILVGGWTNPFEKYARRIGSFSP